MSSDRPDPRRRRRRTPAVLGAAVLAATAVGLVSVRRDGDAGEAPRWRVPPPSVRWQWVLAEPFDISNPRHLGTDGPLAGLRPEDTVIYDVDGFLTTAETVAALHARGAYVVCYVETGGWESYRPDAGAYPPAVLGRAMAGYPDERYVDIRSPAVFEIVRDRIEMCAEKGFDAVEPDIDDSYTESTGFPLTLEDNLAFNVRVARLAHSLGMAIALKNGDEPAFAAAMEPEVDFAIVEQCFEYDTCESFAPFTRAGKAVLAVEYDMARSSFCARARALGFSAVRLDPSLDGRGRACH
jgi:hypothetical protein